MKIAQTIIDYIIAQMKISIGNDVDGAGIGIVDTSGRVVSSYISDSGERDFLGLSDTRGNYFYFRLNGSPVETRLAAGAKFGSCGTQIQTRIPLKLVVQHRCQSSAELIEVFKSNLFRVNLNRGGWGYDIFDIKLIPVSFNVSPWDVWKSETGRDANEFGSMWQIGSVDFILQIQYTYSDKCISFDLC
jgi:hypothetical protein